MRTSTSALFAAAVMALPPTPADAQVIYTITDLGSFGYSSGGQGLNGSGQIAGASTYPNLPNGQPGATHAVRTAPNGRIGDPGSDLGTLPGGTSSSGRG
ncbi:MAG TPA: hypothetical protein VL371_01910, partial [Gemmataceae bacterium]|nr:hypothetical protein [Gemmataceae bacterium]